MAAIHELSSVTPLEKMDIFEVPATQTSALKTTVTEYRPINVIDSNSPLEFLVQSSLDEYINLSETKLSLKLRVDLKQKDVNAATWEKIAPVQNLLPSIFEQVDLIIGDKQITGSHQTNAYRAYFDTLVGFNKAAKSSFLSTQGWYEENISSVNNVSTIRGAYLAPDADATDLTKGSVMNLTGKLYLDLAQQMKPILGGATLRFKLTPNSPKFYLHSKEATMEPKVVFLEASLEVSKTKVSQEIVEAHAAALRQGPALYPITRSEVKKFTINSGVLDVKIDNAISGQMPRQIFMALVDNKACNGDLAEYPYNFLPYNLNHVSCHVNGEQYPATAYQPNFKKGSYSREYYGFFEALHQNYSHPNLKINQTNYLSGGYTFFGIDLSNDRSEGCGSGGHVDPIKYGSLRVDLQFAEATPKTLNLIVFVRYENVLKIGNDRNPIDFV
jgi:hypothetical protein